MKNTNEFLKAQIACVNKTNQIVYECIASIHGCLNNFKDKPILVKRLGNRRMNKKLYAEISKIVRRYTQLHPEVSLRFEYDDDSLLLHVVRDFDAYRPEADRREFYAFNIRLADLDSESGIITDIVPLKRLRRAALKSSWTVTTVRNAVARVKAAEVFLHAATLASGGWGKAAMGLDNSAF